MIQLPKRTPVTHFLVVFGLVFGLGLGLPGCNDDSDGLSVDGTWTGEISENQFEFTLMLLEEGNNQITGLADVDSPLAGTVQGDVDGVRDNSYVTFTIALDHVIVGGSLVFEGVFQDEETLTGTMGSGLLGGTFPITFQRRS